MISLDGAEPLPGRRLTLRIGREGIGGSSGCNEFGGWIDKMDEGVLVWSKDPTEGFTTTQVGCSKPAVRRQETAYQRAVASAGSYRLSGDRPELRDGDGQTELVFVEKAR